MLASANHFYSNFFSKKYCDLGNILKVGDTFQRTHNIEKKHTTHLSKDSLSTHNMIYMVEDVCSDNLEEKLPPKHTSVGFYVDMSHDKPVPTGNKIKINAEVSDIDKNKITFKTNVYDEYDKLISSGIHKRAVIQFK